jgi:SAM-dependent methyltransferase
MRTRISVFLITLSGLILEVGLTRIYSASIWYHFAFVAISVALLGWGLGGFTVHLLKKVRPMTMNAAALTTLLYAGAVPLCLWLLVRYPFDMDRLALYFLAPVVPFFLAGMALSIVFDIHRAVAGTLYFYDLVGAALGAVLVTLLLHVFGGEAALLVGAIAPAVAGLLLATGAGSRESGAGEKEVRGQRSEVSEAGLSPASRAQENKNNASDPGVARDALTPGYSMSRLQRENGVVSKAAASRGIQVAAVAMVLVTLGCAFAAIQFGAFRVKPGTTKAMRNQMDASPGSKIVQTGWNAYSRIDCVEGLPDSFARLYIDSDAWTGIRGWDGNLDHVQDMKGSYRALPWKLTPNAETLIIGPGGGPDVVAALASGSKKVTAVEMNPLMLKFVRSYGARAGNLYDRPDVETIQSEGRNFISRTDRKFDIILLGFVDSWASVASGGLSLSENYLYTTEAVRAYYDHLKPDGILVILRWEMDIPRLVSNSVATLGSSEASKRIVVLMEKQANPNDYSQMLFMLRKRAFSDAEVSEISTKWTQANVIVGPNGTAPPGIKEVLAGTKTLEQYDNESPRYVGPVWDDSPFYFAIDRPYRMPKAIAENLRNWLVAPSLGMLALFAVFGVPRRKSVLLDSTEQASKGGILQYGGSLIYFAALGFGFIAVELALLQNLTLLVGHPIYSLSVLLFTLLAFGGIGSALSVRFPMWMACAAVAVIGAIEALALPRLVPALLWLPLWGRIAVAIVMIAPLGLAMGMPFPRGLRETGNGTLPAPPFYWGLNGIMSVIGSVITVFVALTAGFQAAMLMGSACYLLAALASKMAFQNQLAVGGEQ